tara:strand:+ start:90 stop:830 length:741 start_codon:yes stop_codon:yes gene_type:complete
MIKYFTNNFPIINLYKKPNKRSEVVTQMIYGESFSVLKKTQKWLKIKILEDGYKGFVLSKKYMGYIKPTHKVNSLKAYVYKFPNRKKRNSLLSFGSKIKVFDKKDNFLRFHGGWINDKSISLISYKDKDLFKRIKIFKNIKYKWGGKTFKGIDCSALVQVCLNFNNKFCPRDTKDQVRYFKKNIKAKNIRKNDIIYWKGHVAVALSKKNLIHAYGPLKKTIIMGIDRTLNRIEKTANLKLKEVKRI